MDANSKPTTNTPISAPNPIASSGTAQPSPITPSNIAELLKQPESSSSAPRINLLHPDESGSVVPPPPTQTATKAAAPHVFADKTPHSRRLWPVLVAGALVMTLSGGAGYWLLTNSLATKKGANDAPQKPVQTQPPATPQPSVDPLPAATPPASAAPIAETVTAPSATPTASNPQTVTVKSPNGIWLRSSPSSANRNNIIGWIPNGGQVKVDQVGDFWWHGTYNGKTGYFASNYTQ